MRKPLLIAVASVFIFAAGKVSAQTQDTTKKSTTTTTTTSTTTAPAATLDVASLLAASSDYSTAATAVKAAGLDAALKTGGPYTIFAPNNAAFSKLPQGKLDSLTKDPAKLATFLKGHVVTGSYTKADIIKALTAGKGKATLNTLDGQTLTLSVSPTKTLLLTNSAGSSAEVTLYDLMATNGVINGINGVLAPKQ
ncbi:fasciclin domain-containing protein [Mucilaginibacter sp. KACC 22063]|uniref:fasciclin domain-containing protein n=1 Tax=Mucilaginibacter sp. KACC 22063 TaxID=3025666 RepID=UPI00236716F7|nr:fasciclin domain-containing protein [Mucilaginibacter sp. KACC 22063]WDF55209.1 fasciclin domain-containing protein [Mucilaginibacter sp. KACC 22063]